MDIKYSDTSLLLRNQGLTDCCCDSDTGLFWEGIPCDMNLMPRTACTEYNSCQFENRIFITQDSYCEGNIVTTCECQRVRIGGWINATEPQEFTDIVTFTYFGTNTGTITVTDTDVTMTADGFSTFSALREDYDTIDQLLSAMASFATTTQSGSWSISGTTSAIGLSIRALKNSSFTLANSEQDSWDTISSGIYLKFGSITEIFVASSTDMETFADSIEDALSAAIGENVRCYVNAFYSGGSNLWIDMKFTDNCGSTRNHIELDFSVMPDLTFEFEYADNSDYRYFDPYAGTDKFYFVIGDNIPCPLESDATNGPFANPEIGCCPQVGATVGPYQFIVNSTGYFAGEGWSNLENTVKYQENCYSVSPGFFVLGMEGRLSYNQMFDKELHVVPDCDSNNLCQDYSPTNCVKELFLPLFHQDIPWGPFGSYYPNIESRVHPAWQFPYNTNSNPLTNGFQAFLSSGDPEPTARVGYDYRPQAYIKTRGEWLSTKEIEIVGYVKRPNPYHVGDLPFDDASGYVSIDATTIDPSLNVTYPQGEGCGPFNIVFNTSGKTVGDFVDAVNALKMEGFSSECGIFSFCAANNDARNLPSDQIINTSSEIADHNIRGDEATVGDPDSDNNLLSGATVIMPKSYVYYFGNSTWNQLRYTTFPGKVTTYYLGGLTSYNVAATSPPECRITKGTLPKETPTRYLNLNTPNKHWFTNINSRRENVLGISLNTDIDPTGYPNWTEARIECVSGKINYYASGLALCTGFVDTNKQGSGYTHNDAATEIESISFTWASGTINPWKASGIGPYNIWLDDQTSYNAGTYSYSTGNPTAFNYSYREPLVDSTSTDVLTSSGYLQSLVRRRCLYGGFSVFVDHATGLPILPYCLPEGSNNISTANLNCDGDDYIVGSWVLGFGCMSNNCKTRWYYKTERCECDTVWRCSPLGPIQEPHPFNQPENGLNNTYWNNHGWENYSVAQPTLYVCEHNFHPDCDIPMMVKVPFQVKLPDGSIDYQMGDSNVLPGKFEFCDPNSDASMAASNVYGWCQYIDPQGSKVREEDIPKTDPPTAYVAERTVGSFCSVNPWNYKPESVVPGAVATAVDVGANIIGLPDGCNTTDSEACSFGCASCNWDRICNLYAAGDNYIISYSDPAFLCALFRPIVQDLTRENVCEGAGLDRIDIDCSTTCCECSFTCSVEGGPLNNKVGNSWTQDMSYEVSSSTESPISCRVIADTACLVLGCCVVTPPPCPFPDGNCIGPPCYTDAGIETVAYDISLSRTVSHCGCRPMDDTCVETVVTPGAGACDGAAPCTGTHLESPDSSPSSTICFNCTNLEFPPILNTSDSGSSESRPCDGCSGFHYDQIFTTDYDITYSGSETSDGCTGAATYNYSMTSSNTQTVTGDNSCGGTVSQDYNTSYSIVYSLSAKSWASCGYDTPLEGKSYDYIKAWNLNRAFICGQVGTVISVSGVDDPLYVGPYC